CFPGEIEHAEPLHRRALEIRLERLGSDHKDVAFSLHNLSLVYSARGDDEEAGRYMSRANEIWEMAYAKPPGGDDDAAAAASDHAGADGGAGDPAGSAADGARASRTPSASSSPSAASEPSSRSGDMVLSPAAAAAAAAAEAGWAGVMGSMFGGGSSSSRSSSFCPTAPPSVERARRSLCGENKVGCTTS
ncbi:unnamed protein product, partial [Ectocarpus fasciculatus]